MKKKLVALFMVGLMSVSLAACGETTTSTPESNKSEKSLSADKKLLDVEITIPASLLDEEDDFELGQEEKDKGIKQITKNEDGSMTIKMSKKAHKEFLSEMKEAIDENITEILKDKENCPAFTEITYNDDATVFDIKVDKSLYGGLDSFYALTFYMAGNMYQAMNAVPESEIKTVVNFIDKDTGEVIESGDSSELDNSSDLEEN